MLNLKSKWTVRLGELKAKSNHTMTVSHTESRATIDSASDSDSGSESVPRAATAQIAVIIARDQASAL